MGKYTSAFIQPRANIACSELMEKYSEAKIHKSKPEPRNGNVNSVYFHSPAEIFESVVRSLLTINKYAIGNIA